MAETREVTQGRQYQGVDEVITYSIDTAGWGGSPTSPDVTVYSYVAGVYTDVTATVMPAGSASVDGDVITLPPLRALTLGTLYRVEIQFNVDGAAPGEAFFWVLAER